MDPRQNCGYRGCARQSLREGLHAQRVGGVTPILLLIVLLLLFGGLGGGYVGWSHYGAPGGLGAALLVILVCYLIARRLEI